MLSHLSLTQRILLSATVLLSVFIGLIVLVLDRAFYDSALSARQERLLSQVYLLIAASEIDRQGKLTIVGNLPESRFSLPNSGLYAQIYDQKGLLVWSSQSSIGQAISFQQKLQSGEKQFRVLPDYLVQSLGISWVLGAQQFGFSVHVGENHHEFQQQINTYRSSLWRWLIGLAVLLLVTQLWVLLRGLRPLQHVAQELDAIENGNQAFIQGSYPQEISRLSNRINVLLQHERAQQTRYRNSLGDLAHSLKTPLAVLRGHLNELESGQSVFFDEQIRLMDHIVAYQLQRATTSARQQATPQHTNIQKVLIRIIDSLAKVYRDKHLIVHHQIDPQASVNIDEGDLFELLGNVLDNAHKWASKTITINVEQKKQFTLLVVADDGPGIPEAQIQSILQRGIRADEQTPGHGIGMSIVCDIIDAYQGNLLIEQSQLGGAKVSLKLPSKDVQ